MSKKSQQPKASVGYAVHQEPVAAEEKRLCSLHNRMNYPQSISTGSLENDVIVVPPNGVVHNVNKDTLGTVPAGIVIA